MRKIVASNPGQSAISPEGISAFDESFQYLGYITTCSFPIFSNSSFIRHPNIRPHVALTLTRCNVINKKIASDALYCAPPERKRLYCRHRCEDNIKLEA